MEERKGGCRFFEGVCRFFLIFSLALYGQNYIDILMIIISRSQSNSAQSCSKVTTNLWPHTFVHIVYLCSFLTTSGFSAVAN